MEDVTTKHGRTILFVSHNMGAIRNLCSNGIVLQNGIIDFEDEINRSVDHYINNSKLDIVRKTIIGEKHRKSKLAKDVELLSVELLNETEIATNEPIQIKMTLKVNNIGQRRARIAGMLNSNTGIRVGLFFSEHFSLTWGNDPFDVIVKLTNHNLAKGQYYFDFNIGTGDPVSGVTDFDILYNVISFEVTFDDYVNKSLIAKWTPNWGYNNWKQVEVKLARNESY